MIWKVLIIISLVLSIWSAIGVWCNTDTLRTLMDLIKYLHNKKD